MHTTIATAMAPAWQVREAARKKFLEGAYRKIDELAARRFIPLNTYRILLHLLSRKLSTSRAGISTIDIPEINMDEKWDVFHLFLDISGDINRFQRSKKEEYALFAKLLEWTASKIAGPHHATLQTQEMLEPELIYGTKDRMAEIPFE